MRLLMVLVLLGSANFLALTGEEQGQELFWIEVQFLDEEDGEYRYVFGAVSQDEYECLVAGQGPMLRLRDPGWFNWDGERIEEVVRYEDAVYGAEILMPVASLRWVSVLKDNPYELALETIEPAGGEPAVPDGELVEDPPEF